MTMTEYERLAGEAMGVLRQGELSRLNSLTVVTGMRIWFLHTHKGWMEAWVRATHRNYCLVEPVPGTVRRELALSWSEVHWKPTF
jgi:hypothetical protein